MFGFVGAVNQYVFFAIFKEVDRKLQITAEDINNYCCPLQNLRLSYPQAQCGHENSLTIKKCKS